VTPTSILDPYEPNDSFEQAYGPLAFDVTYEAYIWTERDKDYYKLEVPDLGILTLDLTNIPVDTDYDLMLYDDERHWLAGSHNPGNDDEYISHPALWPGTYYILVEPFGNFSDQFQPYRLTAHFQISRTVLQEDHFDNPERGWPVNDVVTRTLEYRDGEYRNLVKAAHESSIALAPGNISEENYVVEVDAYLFNPVNAPNESYGLVIESNPSSSSYYAFQVRSDGQFSLSKRLNDIDVILVPWTASSFVYTGTMTNHLQVVRQNFLIRASVNGYKVTEREDGDISGALRVGLIAATEDAANVDARFDNFGVYTVKPTGQYLLPQKRERGFLSNTEE